MARRRSTATRRRSTRRRRATTTFTVSGRVVRELLALLLVIMAVVSVIALFAPQAGLIVQPWHDLLTWLLGWGIAFAAPLLAGFALMLWMKSMPSERWMAATGAALVAVTLLGMFHLIAGGAGELVGQGDGGGAIGFAVSRLLVGAIGDAGAWVLFGLLFVVGLLLYFNMTVGDLLAAWLQGREEQRELAALEARRAASAERRLRADAPPPPP
ncbi:MAG: DNA translocase FtsK 4TM domain-containing protein, partial [Candidatus Limnocylindria bacterium]